jgi:hypothetical protein
MTDRVQIQLVLAKNSRPPSSSSGVVPQHAKPIAISPAPHLAPSKPAEHLSVQRTMLVSIVTNGPSS